MRRVRTLVDLPPPAIVDGAARVAGSGVLDRAERLSGWLAARGVRHGEVVAFQLGNRWQAVVAFHACWRLGATALPVHPRVRSRERDAVLAEASPSAVLVMAGLDPPDGAVAVGGHDDPFDDPTAPTIGAREVEADDIAVLLATSGSTGRPKLARHTHGGLAGKAAVMVAAHGLTPDDVVLMPAPLAHVSGLLNGVLLPGAAGMTTVLVDRWDPGSALATIQREHVSFMIGPPTFFVDLVNSPAFSPEAVASLRLVSCGGASVTPGFVRDTAHRLGAVVKRTYGSTEAPTITTWHVGDPAERAAETDGRATPGVDLRVVDPATDAPLADGETGALLVRGPEICTGYTDPAATAAAFTAGGWYRTGDLARIDDGWLTVVGRIGDTIIRGGENVSPAAVEAACAGLPGVRFAVAVGYPDDRLGERVGLVVEGEQAPPLHAVQQACAAAGLAPFAWPDRVTAHPQLPRLDAGKPDRRRIAALVRDAIQQA